MVVVVVVVVDVVVVVRLMNDGGRYDRGGCASYDDGSSSVVSC